MKKAFFFAWATLACFSLFAITGCEKAGELLEDGFHHHNKPSPVTMNFESYTTKQGTGTFTSSGGLQTSGTYVMVVERIDTNNIHCTTTMTTPHGTFTTLSDCQLNTMLGVWTISKGTGDYADLRGNGTLKMLVSAEGKKVETLDGTVQE